MTLWIVLGVLMLLGVGFVAWPLYRRESGLSILLAGVIVFTVGLSAGLYHYLGSPAVPSGAGSTPDVAVMAASLAARLERNPDDVNGWVMLARSYQTLGDLGASITAYEQAVELEYARNSQTLVGLALVLLEQNKGQLSDRASGLFENALALEPNDPNALFYAGGAAAQRGNTALAADRWEILLGLNAPPEVRELLQKKINEWRGVPATAAEDLSAAITLQVSLSNEAQDALAANASVFIIARDPMQPSPPIAVARRVLSELPTTVELSDRDAMIPGRPLSGFARVELVARVSISGAPAAQPGDWFASAIVDRGSSDIVELLINQKIP